MVTQTGTRDPAGVNWHAGTVGTDCDADDDANIADEVEGIGLDATLSDRGALDAASLPIKRKAILRSPMCRPRSLRSSAFKSLKLSKVGNSSANNSSKSGT